MNKMYRRNIRRSVGVYSCQHPYFRTRQEVFNRLRLHLVVHHSRLHYVPFRRSLYCVFKYNGNHHRGKHFRLNSPNHFSLQKNNHALMEKSLSATGTKKARLYCRAFCFQTLCYFPKRRLRANAIAIAPKIRAQVAGSGTVVESQKPSVPSMY